MDGLEAKGNMYSKEEAPSIPGQEVNLVIRPAPTMTFIMYLFQ